MSITDNDYQLIEQTFDVKGLDLNNPTDRQARPDRVPYVINVRRHTDGTIRKRPGLNPLSMSMAPTGKTPLHSLRRLVNKETSEDRLVSGIGTILAVGGDNVAISEVDTGYSGHPLTLLPFRPEHDRSQWMAVFDSNKNRKVSITSQLHQLGLPQPTVPPRVALTRTTAPLRSTIDLMEATTDWTSSTAGAVTTTSRVSTAAHNPVRQARYPRPGVAPTGTMDWYAMEIQDTTAIGPGTILKFGGSDTRRFHVFRVFRGSEVTQVDEVVYEGLGGTGRCTIIPRTALNELQQGVLVAVDDVFYCVEAVMTGSDGRKAFIIQGGAGIAAGDRVDVRTSIFGFWTDNNTAPTNGEGVTAVAIAAPTFSGASSYWIKKDLSGSPLNLQSGYGSATQTVDLLNDIMHAGVWSNNWEQILEIKLQADVDNGNFDKNFYTRTVRPNDLIRATQNLSSAIDTRAVDIRNDRFDRAVTRLETRREQEGGRETPRRFHVDNPRIDYDGVFLTPPGTAASQTGTGQNQWSEVFFRMGDFEKVGTDPTKTLQNVVAVRVLIVPKDSTVSIQFAVDDWYVTGGYEPDVANNAPYEYRYRYRVQETGARSNWSPPARANASPNRQDVSVFVSGTNVAEVDRIDIQRRGGTVNDWVTIFSVTKTAGAGLWQEVTDKYSDSHALGAAASAFAVEGDTNYQPFPEQTASVKGSTANLAGTLLHQDAAFDVNWAPGTPIIVNGVPTLIYQVHSASLLEVFDVCGAVTRSGSTGAYWEIPTPTVLSRTLPVAFPLGRGWYGACGSTINPGRLYLFNKDTLDSTSGRWVDVTDGNDPLQNGCEYAERGYVWSSNGMFMVDPETLDVIQIDGAKGLYARWCLTTGDQMYWLGDDGVYASNGTESVNVTRRDLGPLFADAERDGVAVNGIPGVQLYKTPSLAVQSSYRVCYTENRLYFKYSSTNVLVLDKNTGTGDWGWWYDNYPLSIGVYSLYVDERAGSRSILIGSGGAPTAKIYRLSMHAESADSALDDGQSIFCRVRSFLNGSQDRRTEKLIGDVFTDLDPGGQSVTPYVFFDDFNTAPVAGSAISGAGRTGPRLIDFDGGRHARSVAVDIFWTVTSATAADAVLYGWGFSAMSRPPDTIQRATDYSLAGYPGPKNIRGVYIHADTEGATKNVLVEYTKDDGTVANYPLTINHPVKTSKYYSFPAQFIAYALRLRPTDASTWKLYPEAGEWVYDRYPPLTPAPPPWTDDGHPGAKYLYGVIIEVDTENAARGVTVRYDDLVGATPGTGAKLEATLKPTLTQQHNDRTTIAYDITSPVICHLMQLVPGGNMRLFNVKWLWDPWPEYAAFVPDFSDLGVASPKHFRGVNIEADTTDPNGNARTVLVDVHSDSAGVVDTLSLSHAGRMRKPYNFDPPFVAHGVRLVPLTPLRVFKADWIFDEYPELSKIVTPWEDGGSPGTNYVRGLILTADTGGQSVQVKIEGDEGATLDTKIVNHSGQSEKSYAFNPPLVAHKVRLVPQDNIRIFSANWIMDPYPESNVIMTPWTDDGFPGPKYLQGFVLNADTGGASTSFKLQKDGEVDVEIFTGTHTGQVEIAYALATPAILHNMRIIPSGNMRIFGVRWIWTPEALLGHRWYTQEWELGDPYGFLRDFEIEYASNATVSLAYYVDGVLITTEFLNSTGGTETFKRVTVDLPAKKGRLAKIELGAISNFRVREKGSVAHGKDWRGPNLLGFPAVGAPHGTGAEV